jgi:hypothetical protein
MELSPSLSPRCSARAIQKSVMTARSGAWPAASWGCTREDVRRLEVPVPRPAGAWPRAPRPAASSTDSSAVASGPVRASRSAASRRGTLHREERQPISPRVEGVVEPNPADVEVGDAPGEQHLAPETPWRSVGAELGRMVQRHARAQRGVLGLVDRTHAAPGDEARWRRAPPSRPPPEGRAVGHRAARRWTEAVVVGSSGCSDGAGAMGFRRGLSRSTDIVGAARRLAEGAGGPQVRDLRMLVWNTV